MKRKTTSGKLRSGFTTGACAAAAAKAAVIALLGKSNPDTVTIPFPDGSRHAFALCRFAHDPALATVVKDAGDDPDVTNGAEIGAIARLIATCSDTENIVITNGHGVGIVTKPGLPVAVGEPAINPVPRQMIRAAVTEALQESRQQLAAVEVSIFVEHGEALAEKTLNRRLGIVGGLSILGTTGIVRPVSAEAWTDTIEASMNVAQAAGLTEIVLSTGRTSEAQVQQILHCREEALVMMGDYLRYSLEAAGRHGFSRIHLAAMWAKLIKAALAVPQTHVRNGALEMQHAADLFERFGLDARQVTRLRSANTSREMYTHLVQNGREDLIEKTCHQAMEQAKKWSGLPVEVYLVDSDKGVVCHVTD